VYSSSTLSTKYRWPISAVIATPIGLGRRDSGARMVVMAERSHFITSLVVGGDALYIGKVWDSKGSIPRFIGMIYRNWMIVLGSVSPHWGKA